MNTYIIQVTSAWLFLLNILLFNWIMQVSHNVLQILKQFIILFAILTRVCTLSRISVYFQYFNLAKQHLCRFRVFFAFFLFVFKLNTKTSNCRKFWQKDFVPSEQLSWYVASLHAKCTKQLAIVLQSILYSGSPPENKCAHFLKYPSVLYAVL